MSSRTTVFFLHFLGGSLREWDQVADALSGDFRCIALDLPGFGEATSHSGHSVSDMADAIASDIRGAALQRYALVGHSMGAKVATVLAHRAEAGDEGLGGLDRLVVMAGSPPGPEPMDETKRQTMMTWFSGDAASCRAQAEGYIDQNTGRPLDPGVRARAVHDVLAADPTAWRAWLESGSREDWSERIGTLGTPTLVIAGTDDPALGPRAQRRLMLPHFADARMVVLAGAKHLLPMECADDVARLIREHVESRVPC